jgi:DNA-binding GntR family transcriptional regulator
MEETVSKHGQGKTQQAYQWIVLRIKSAAFAPGDYVNENSIAGELGMNRSAVREAINQLIAEGLLEKRDNRRVYVVELEEGQRDTLRRFRAAIESGAAYFAALHRTAGDIKALKDFIQEHCFLVERQYWEGVAKADERFHHRIITASCNSMLINAYERSKIRLRISSTPNPEKNEYESTIPEHNAILEAIENREAEDARNLLWKHLIKQEKTS